MEDHFAVCEKSAMKKSATQYCLARAELRAQHCVLGACKASNQGCASLLTSENSMHQ